MVLILVLILVGAAIRAVAHYGPQWRGRWQQPSRRAAAQAEPAPFRVDDAGASDAAPVKAGLTPARQPGQEGWNPSAVDGMFEDDDGTLWFGSGG